MNFYNYSIDLPFTGIKLKYREITTEEQIYLAKAVLSFPDQKDSYIDYNNFLFNLISNCIENKEDFKKINLVEYVLFLTKLRIISVGNKMDFMVPNEDKNTKTKISINLNSYLMRLYEASNFFQNQTIKDDNIEIKLNWPILASINTFNDLFLNKTSEIDLINETIQEYIEWIKINEKIIKFIDFTTKQKSDLLNKIPYKIKLIIQNKMIDGLKHLLNSEVFDVSIFKEQKFNFYNLSFLEHIKILYSYDVKSIFYELFVLSNSNIDSNYIMKISPNERKILLSIVEEQRKSNQKSNDISDDILNQNFDPNQPSKDLFDLAVEFGDEVPK